MAKTYVIIGSSAAGISAVNQLRICDPEGTIICISRQTEAPYNTCRLTKWLAGKLPYDGLFLSYDQHERTHLLLGKTVEQIVTDKKYVQLTDGETIAYDALLIAIGAAPRLPSYIAQIQHTEVEEKRQRCRGIFPFYSLSDARAVHAYREKYAVKKVVIIGGGVTGIECAIALHAHGITVTLIEQAPLLMRQWYDEAASYFLQEHLERIGIQLVLGDSVCDIEEEQQYRVICTSGRTVETAMVIYAGGVAPVSVGDNTSLPVTDTGAYLVDEYLQTAWQGVYAAGDCAMVQPSGGSVYEQTHRWSDAVMQGMHAAYGMSGKHRVYTQPFKGITSDSGGLPFTAFGILHGDSINTIKTVRTDDRYEKYLYTFEGQLCGFILIGTLEQAGFLRKQLCR